MSRRNTRPLPTQRRRETVVISNPAPVVPDVFAQALERSEKAQKEVDREKRTKRHPALITAERLVEAARLYADRLTPAEVRALQVVHHALTEVGNRQR